MCYVIEFLLYFIFFIFKLYSLVDKFYILNKSGAKLDKYVKNNLLNITCNLDGIHNSNSFFQNFNSNNSIRPLISPKKIYITIILYSNILMIKFAFSYNFIKSNFIYIKIFSKNIDISSMLGKYFILFKVLYFVFFSVFVINLSYKFVSYYIDKKSKKKVSMENDSLKIFIGKDENDNNVYIKNNGIFQNVLITGSIGSGKTSSAISNIMLELVKNNILGLIIDVKGSYIEDVKKILSNNFMKESIIEISLDNDFKYNPIDKPNKSSIELANELRLVLTLLSETKNSDSYWLDKVESFLSDFITIIRAKREIVNFYELHRLVNEKEYLFATIKIIKEKILKNEYDEDELFNINSAISNIKNEFLKLDDRTIGIIKSEITRITGIFASDKRLYKKFCGKNDNIDFYNNIYVLSINIGKDKKLLKVIATYLKLDFQKQILSNFYSKKRVFFICDEYQEIANVEDANFFSISREYKCINVISMQSYSSLLNALNNEYSSRVIIQNLVNKIWFRNDDVYTVNETIKQIGKEIRDIKTTNFSENAQNTRLSITLNKFKSYNSSLTKGISFSEKEDYIFNENYFTRGLQTFQAVCLLSDGKQINLYKNCTLKRLE